MLRSAQMQVCTLALRYVFLHPFLKVFPSHLPALLAAFQRMLPPVAKITLSSRKIMLLDKANKLQGTCKGLCLLDTEMCPSAQSQATKSSCERFAYPPQGILVGHQSHPDFFGK